MLINLSNHPSASWSEKQLSDAKMCFGSILDMEFPQISPDLDSDGLDLLVDHFSSEIGNLNPDCVHIMGEMTFTFRLVNRLKSSGFKCVASTTERIVSVDGAVKSSVFRFVQFRPY
jgi:hypothetical protein